MKYIIIAFVISLAVSEGIQSKLLCKSCHAMVKAVQMTESLADPGIVFFLKTVAEGYCAFKKLEDTG